MKKIVPIVGLLAILCGCSESSSSDADILDTNTSNSPVGKVSVNEIKNEETRQKSVESEKEKGIHEVAESSIEKEVAFWRVISDTINIRKSPNIQSQPIAIGKKDQDLEYLHHKYLDPSDNRIWYNIKNNQGTIGWVSSVVVVQADGQHFNQSERNTSSVQVIMKSNIRMEPSIDSTSVSIVEKGAHLESIGGATMDYVDGRMWYPVKTKLGETGWISSKVISISSTPNLDISNPETYVGTWERFITPDDADHMIISLTFEKEESNGYSFYINDKNNYLGAHAGTSGNVLFDNQGEGQAKVTMSSKTGSEGEYEYTTKKGNIKLLDDGILYDGPIMSGNDGYSNYTLLFQIQWNNNDEGL